MLFKQKINESTRFYQPNRWYMEVRRSMFDQGKNNTICPADNVSDDTLLGLHSVRQHRNQSANVKASFTMYWLVGWLVGFTADPIIKPKNLTVLQKGSSLLMRGTYLDSASNPGQHRGVLATLGHQGDQVGMQITIGH